MTSDDPLSGTVTFLFTDIVDSTSLWDHAPQAMQRALAGHDAILRGAVAGYHGRVVKTTGDGFHAVFPTALGAAEAALAAQAGLLALPSTRDASGEEVHIRARMGIHTGESEVRNGDYYGSAVNRAARLMSIGHGGQILLSAVAATLVDGQLPAGCSLAPLGEFRLRGLSRPEQVVQLDGPGLPHDFPPPNADMEARGNLPEALTTFVGRGRELGDVKRLLASNRLVTIVGPGGTGKTRLSLQVARDVQDGFAQGAWLVELAAIPDPELVTAAVGALWGVKTGVLGPVDEQLLNYLRGKQMLLILDNCEHLVAACARLAATLLPEAPGLTILANSREGLEISGEFIYHLTPLKLPDQNLTAAAELGGYESIQLFEQRARAARETFMLTDQNVLAVAQIVRRLDGIPLAIELAAARIAVLSPEQLAARLDDRFKLLTGGSRTALPRQQTLRALIDWSYDLLNKDEQWFFRQLGVFVGGWSLEAAEALIPNERPDLDALDLLSELVNKSLVSSTEGGGMPRFGFLETIRQYARDKLVEVGEDSAAANRHLDYFGRQITAFAPITSTMTEGLTVWGIGDPRLAAWTDERMLDLDNFGAALTWATQADPWRGLALTLDMAAAYGYVGRFDELIERLRASLAAVGPVAGPDESANGYRQWLILNSLVVMSMATVNLGKFAEAHATSDQAVQYARGLGQPYEEGLATAITAGIGPGLFIGASGQIEVATEALDIFTRHGHRREASMPLTLLARDRFVAGDDEAGNALLDEALVAIKEMTSAFWIGVAAISISVLTQSMVQPEKMQAIIESGLRYLQSQGYPILALATVSELGHLARRGGDLDAAEARYRETLPQWLEYGHRPGLANQLESFGFIAIARTQYERAATLLGAAEALRDQSGGAMTMDERGVYDVQMVTLRAALDAPTLDARWQAGRALDAHAAVTFALS